MVVEIEVHPKYSLSCLSSSDNVGHATSGVYVPPKLQARESMALVTGSKECRFICCIVPASQASAFRSNFTAMNFERRYTTSGVTINATGIIKKLIHKRCDESTTVVFNLKWNL